MIATGLMAFGSRYGHEDMVTRGVALAEAIGDEISDSGTLQSIPPTSGTVSSRSAWSTEGLAHLVKATQCLVWAGDVGSPDCARAAATLVADSVRVQREDGRFVTHPADQEKISLIKALVAAHLDIERILGTAVEAPSA